MKILESSENYLETILMLKNEGINVRAIDVVNELGFSKASVSVAMKHLREDGFISVDKNNIIELLPAGLEIAQKMYERHVVISKGLIAIGVDEEIATHDACKIEHIISTETFECIKAYLHKVGKL
ncbi:MAG: metal-dependent transcriptional regulator [Clostridia bacterium]